MPDRIVVYREPHLHEAEDLDALRDLVHVTLVHEIAHFHGIDDDRLHEPAGPEAPRGPDARRPRSPRRGPGSWARRSGAGRAGCQSSRDSSSPSPRTSSLPSAT